MKDVPAMSVQPDQKAATVHQAAGGGIAGRRKKQSQAEARYAPPGDSRPRVYADSAATSFQKPPAVLEAMVRFARECCVAPGRGSFRESRQCQQMIATCRERLARLINAQGPDRIIFTLNCSDALNIAIRGLLALAGGKAHAIATAMDHNSVLRPYHTLARQTGLQFDIIACDPCSGLVDVGALEKAIRPQTRLITCIHASNVTGVIEPVAEVAALARRRNIPVLVDASQTAGYLPVDVQALGVDLMAFAGHKGLLGPLGTGALYLGPGMEHKLETIREGGTGVLSELTTQPEDLPHKLEVGSPNAIGIAGLSEGIEWLLQRTIPALQAHDQRLAGQFLDAVAKIPGLKVYGPGQGPGRVAVFSVSLAGFSPADLGKVLESEFGVLTRAGLHCAPLAHKTIGTFPQGACRLSFGAFSTEADVAYVIAALRKVARN
jgi:cysteine desulfurase family protein